MIDHSQPLCIGVYTYTYTRSVVKCQQANEKLAANFDLQLQYTAQSNI